MKIAYTAWLKDMIGIDEEVVRLPDEVKNVGMLLDWLATRGQRYEEALEFVEVVKVAVNRDCVENDHAVNDDDEVVLFPPIAGG